MSFQIRSCSRCPDVLAAWASGFGRPIRFVSGHSEGARIAVAQGGYLNLEEACRAYSKSARAPKQADLVAATLSKAWNAAQREVGILFAILRIALSRCFSAIRCSSRTVDGKLINFLLADRLV